MNSKNFAQKLSARANQVRSYILASAPTMAANKTLRFIDGNFQAQGWQGSTFQPWKKNKLKRTPILINKGHLRRSFNYSKEGEGIVRLYSNIQYSKIHNQGGTINETVQVGAFERKYPLGASKSKKSKARTGRVQVKAHTRIMKTVIPQRQFAPYEGHESPVMNASIVKQLYTDIIEIINKP